MTKLGWWRSKRSQPIDVPRLLEFGNSSSSIALGRAQMRIREMRCVGTMMAVVLVLPWVTNAYEGRASRWTPAEIATDRYESSPTFTPDGREIFFMSSDTGFDHYRILWSRCENGL